MTGEIRGRTKAERYKEFIIKNKERYTLKEISKRAGIGETHLYLVLLGKREFTETVEQKILNYLNSDPIPL